MIKEYLKNSWRKLDNTAKIFSLDDKNNTNIFRYSVILKEDVDKEVLKKALEVSLNKFLAFKVRIGTGLFWNYLEFNDKEVIVKQEDEIPCEHINFKKNNDYLFKVTYYKKKINLDVFHVLTDGVGAIKFLKSIIYNYLDFKKDLSFSCDTFNDYSIGYHDEYLKNYDKSLKGNMDFKGAYLLPGKIYKNINNTYHYILDIKEVKNICKKYNVSITEYLTSVYIYSIYLSLYNKKSNKEIVITVPIDLRKHYNVDTLSNFFVCMNINPKILKKNLTSFDDVLNQVHTEFKEKLKKEEVKKYLSRDVLLGMNVSIRLIPLFIKKLFIKYVGFLISKSSTSTLSNVGIINIDEKYKKYIDNILVLVMPGRIQKLKCTICSFDNKLNVTINSNIDDINFEEVFFNLLKDGINNISMQSNNNYLISRKENDYVISKNKK